MHNLETGKEIGIGCDTHEVKYIEQSKLADIIPSVQDKYSYFKIDEYFSAAHEWYNNPDYEDFNRWFDYQFEIQCLANVNNDSLKTSFVENCDIYYQIGSKYHCMKCQHGFNPIGHPK